MGILRALSGLLGGKSLRQAASLLSTGKTQDALRIVEKLATGYEPPIPVEKKGEYAELHALWGRCLAQLKDLEALKHFVVSDEASENESLLREGAVLLEQEGIVSDEATEYILNLAHRTSGEKGFLLNYAKKLVGEGESSLTGREFELVMEASRTFTLWKGGSSLLADKFLEEGRRDAEAIGIYRIAYPTRPQDEKLVTILLEHLTVNNERTEFAAKLYKDQLDRGREDGNVLRLLAEYYIEQQEVTPGTIEFIERALEKKMPGHEYLEAFAGYLLRSRKEFLNKKKLLLLVFRAGYFNKNVLAFLAQAFAEEGNFSAEALTAYEEALKNNLLTKRITLVLTEYFLSEDRRDDFACRVYEHYLGSWPERRQARLYSLLATSYMEKKRVDEQAQLIYEVALTHDPNNPEILPLLAASYLTYETRQPKAFLVYERAFTLLDETHKKQVAMLLAEKRIEDGNFDRRTLDYLELALPQAQGSRREALLEARTKCFLALDRKDEQAAKIYLELYHRNIQERKENTKLVKILSDILTEKPDIMEAPEDLKLRICYERFELEKYECPAGISFLLLEEVLAGNQDYKHRLPLAVRCFDLDCERLSKRLEETGNLGLLQDIGKFYLDRYNYELSAKAYQVANEYEHTEENDYNLAKIRLAESREDEALRLLEAVMSPERKARVLYWRAAALQQKMMPREASPHLNELEANPDSIPVVLIKLRRGLNAELVGDYGDAVELYRDVLTDADSLPYRRWISLEIGIALWRMGTSLEAQKELEAVYRFNPNGRAEQRTYSMILAVRGYELILEGDWDQALNDFIEAIEVNRTDRFLRSVIVDLLLIYAKRYFFNREFEMAVKMLEVAHRVLPKSMDVKVYLAYSYHLLRKYAQALIYYRDITWTTDAPMLERSQAYCYIQNNQQEKAWRVFLDLKRRGTLLTSSIPLLLEAYLADEAQEGAETFKDFEFPEDAKSPIPFAAFYIHDGQYDRALKLLSKHAKGGQQELQRLWFMGKACSKQGDRKLAVTYWKQLLTASQSRQTHDETKLSELLEIGLAFLQAGYAQEAMETWEDLKKLAPEFAHLGKLYAYTLDLNAYNLALKSNIKLAIAEWEKAVEYDPENMSIIQNIAIAFMSVDDFDRSAVYWRKLLNRWKVMVDRNPQRYAPLTVAIGEVERLLADVFVSQREHPDEVYLAKTEEMVDYFQRANQFYWILGLNKNATKGQIEKSYFRLVKIFNPERHASDFMLLEDAYANLTESRKRDRIDIFAYEPVDAGRLRKVVLGDSKVGTAFEDLNLHAAVPEPDHSQLEPDDTPPGTVVKKLEESIQYYFRLGDISVV